jgi:methane/ammonia monooxygenase subunit A
MSAAAFVSRAEAIKASRTIDWLIFPIAFLTFCGGFHVHFMLTAGDWDFWVDWKDRRLWPTVTPIMGVTFIAAVQYWMWENFRLPIGGTFVILGLMFGEWINRYFNFWGWTYMPINLVWAANLVPGAILIDCVLLYTGSYIITAVIGALLWGLVMYPGNWAMLAQFHQPVDYNGRLMSVADIIGYNNVRTGTPEYIRFIEKGTLRTFGKDVVPVSAFFSGFVSMLIYFIWHFIGRWFATTKFIKQT